MYGTVNLLQGQSFGENQHDEHTDIKFVRGFSRSGF